MKINKSFCEQYRKITKTVNERGHNSPSPMEYLNNGTADYKSWVEEPNNGSYDPSIVVEFEDKSLIRIPNPGQEAFASCPVLL